MKLIPSVKIYAATIAVAVLCLSALPAAAQSAGHSRAEMCRATVGAHLLCSAAPASAGTVGNRAYERWQDGSPAVAADPPDDNRYSRSNGSRNTFFGYGR